jgi:hypothetical protein
MHVVVHFLARHAVAVWLGICAVAAFIADWLTGHI